MSDQQIRETVLAQLGPLGSVRWNDSLRSRYVVVSLPKGVAFCCRCKRKEPRSDRNVVVRSTGSICHERCGVKIASTKPPKVDTSDIPRGFRQRPAEPLWDRPQGI